MEDEPVDEEAGANSAEIIAQLPQSEDFALLIEVFKEVQAIDGVLDEYEGTEQKAKLYMVAQMIRVTAPKVKQLLLDPKYKTRELAPVVLDIRSGMKKAVARAKLLKESVSKEQRQKKVEFAKLVENIKTKKTSTRDAHALVENARQREVDELKKEVEEKERKLMGDQPPEPPAAVSQAAIANAEAKQRKLELQERLRGLPQPSEEEAPYEPPPYEFSAASEIFERFKPEPLYEATATDPNKAKQDIWNRILHQKHMAEAKQPQIDEYNFIVLGNKNSGKSTLINQYLDKDIDPQTTTALEYTYGTRQRPNSSASDVINAFELAGGLGLVQLFEVTLTPENIHSACVVIVVDLSEPHEALPMLLAWIEQIRERAATCLKQVKRNEENAVLLERLGNFLKEPYEEHPDRSTVKPLGLPCIVVGNKYDVLCNFETERRKILTKTFRYIAHLNGAALMYTSTQRDTRTATAQFKSMINHYLFHTPARATVTDHTKPVYILAGADSFGGIGAPPGATSMDVKLRLMQETYEKAFPPKAKEEEQSPLQMDDSGKFEEPSVDSMRAEKEKELERYQKAAARQMALQGDQNFSNGAPAVDTEA